MKIEKIHNIILYCFVFLFHFEFWNVLGTYEYGSITKFVGYLFFLFALRDIKRFFAFKWLAPFLLPVFFFILLLTLISLFYQSTYSQNVSIFDYQTFQCIIMFWIICNYLRNNPKIIYNTLFFYLLGAITSGCLFYFGIGISINSGRLSIFGDNPNAIGIRMSISILILLSLVFENHIITKKKPYGLLASLPLLLPVLVASGSRTALASFAIGLIAFIIFIKMRTWFKIYFLVFSISSVFILFLYFAESDLIKSRVQSSLEQKDTAGRIEIWDTVLPIFYNSPILGVGLTGYAEVVVPVYGETTSPHNVYIEVLCYTGIVGFFVFLLFLFRIGKQSINNYRVNNLILTTTLLLMILIVFIAGHGLFDKTFWYIYAVTVASGTISSKYDKKGA